MCKTVEELIQEGYTPWYAEAYVQGYAEGCREVREKAVHVVTAKKEEWGLTDDEYEQVIQFLLSQNGEQIAEA